MHFTQCFVWSSEQTATIILNSFHQLIVAVAGFTLAAALSPRKEFVLGNTHFLSHFTTPYGFQMDTFALRSVRVAYELCKPGCPLHGVSSRWNGQVHCAGAVNLGQGRVSAGQM